MKNLLRPLFPALLLATLFTLASCKPHPEPVKEEILPAKDDYTLIDSGRAGFLMPPGGVLLPGLLKAVQKLDEAIICELSLDPGKGYSSVVNISRYYGDTVVPMEIAFIENVMKKTTEFMGCQCPVVNFGVVDLHGKRLRYKVVEFENDCLDQLIASGKIASPVLDSTAKGSASKTSGDIQYLFLCYFMKNDLDSVMYEISMTTSEENFSRTDSLLLNFALGFRIFDK